MRRSLAATILLLTVATLETTARADCLSGGPTFASPYVFTPGWQYAPYGQFDSPATVTEDLEGFFWRLAEGNPTPGAGIDNGAYPALANQFGYFYSGWVRDYFGYTPSFIYGSWDSYNFPDSVDGCISETPAPRCMAVLLSDQRDGVGYFVFMTRAPIVDGSIEHYQFRIDDPTDPFAPIDLVPIPSPLILAERRDDGAVELDLIPSASILEGVHVDAPGCVDGFIEGYRVYQRVVEAGQPPPQDRHRMGESGWTLTHGGQQGDGAPWPLDVGAQRTIDVTGCSDGGELYLALSLVFDSGFETIHVSSDSTPVNCGTCQWVDDDGDGFDGGACASAGAFDCDDARAGVYPGAAQVCDGLNNDCEDAAWPALEGTNELDSDGDGVTECQGDPCPFDAFDDGDADGICSDVDVCPELSDPLQIDSDGDGAGDPCDPCPLDAQDDLDGDGLCGEVDNCPGVPNVGQEDLDEDGLGDPCDDCPLDPDNDLDGDGTCGDVDPCPDDALDDYDDDGQCAEIDPCPFDRYNDVDGDDACANEDNCAGDFNPTQLDADDDGVGDRCDLFATQKNVTTTLENPRDIWGTDIDGDGDLDVVSASYSFFGDDRIAWFDNLSGDGSTWAEISISTTGRGPGNVFASDLDGDLDSDVLSADIHAVRWYRNLSGDGSAWEEAVILALEDASAVWAADLDADGDTDVLSTSTATMGVQWHENLSGDGTAWDHHLLTQQADGAFDVSTPDLDGDKDPDVLFSAKFDDRVGWFENLDGRAGAWQEHTISTTVLFVEEVVAGDLDGDGDTDVASVATVGDRVAWHENLDGGGTAWQDHLVALVENVESVHAVDLDSDGDLDLVTAGGFTSNDRLLWHQNVLGDGTTWTTHHVFDAFPISQQCFAGDVDGDGDADVLALALFSDTISWFPNQGLRANRRPDAVAGPDRSFTRAVNVILDGTASSDPDSTPGTEDDLARYEWYEDYGTRRQTLLGVADRLEVHFGFGGHAVTLRVVDSFGADDTDALLIKVGDLDAMEGRDAGSPARGAFAADPSRTDRLRTRPSLRPRRR